MRKEEKTEPVKLFKTFLIILGAVHKLRHPIRGYRGVSQKMTKDDRGREGVWQKMTDDDDEAGGRREKTLRAL